MIYNNKQIYKNKLLNNNTNNINIYRNKLIYLTNNFLEKMINELVYYLRNNNLAVLFLITTSKYYLENNLFFNITNM